MCDVLLPPGVNRMCDVLLPPGVNPIAVPKLLYFNFFSASFYTTFLSAGVATSIGVHGFSVFPF
jgi:hypothetical protein